MRPLDRLHTTYPPTHSPYFFKASGLNHPPTKTFTRIRPTHHENERNAGACMNAGPVSCVFMGVEL